MGIDYSKYKMIYDYHTHTTFSHGKGSIEDNVRAAISQGLEAIAITDHGPGHLTYGIKREAVPVMRREIEDLNEKYKEIKIFLGVEANVISKKNCLDIKVSEIKDYDFIIAGYHYGVTHGYCAANWLNAKKIWHGDIEKLRRKNTEMTIKAIYENPIKILTHPGDKGPFDIEAIAEACAETDTLMEISTWHPHLTVEEIKKTSKYDVRYIVSSDAHTPDRVGSFHGGVARALKAGLDIGRIVNIKEV